MSWLFHWIWLHPPQKQLAYAMRNEERKSQREIRMVEGKEGYTEPKFIERAKSLGFFEILFYDGAMIEPLHVRIKLIFFLIR